MNNNYSGLVIEDIAKVKAYGEHNGKYYLAYFENIPKEMMYFKFNTRHSLEEFIYRLGIEKFDYKSSNGKIITKIWEYIPKKVEEWNNSQFRTKKEREAGKPEKYSWDDWYLGHFLKE